ncbi:MAG: hypothetical protein GYA14_09635 [Ignavibacteria bacterium]|nr:hypothetical protein [Ignavibacteria bacterium]
MAEYKRKKQIDFQTMEDLELAVRVRTMNNYEDETTFKRMVDELTRRFMNLIAK